MQKDENTLDPQEETKEEEVVEEETTEESTEDDSAEEVERLKAEAAKWRRIAEKKSKPEPQETLPDREENPQNDEIIDLRLEGYSKEEAQFIINNGGRKALEDRNSLVSIALTAKKEQLKAESEAAKAKDTSGATSFEKKFPKDKLEKMSAEELAKILPHSEE